VQHTLPYPNQLNAGAAWRPVEPVLLTFGYTWERQVVYREDLFSGDRGVTVIVPRHFNNGYTFRLGTEITPIERLKVRLGGLRDISPANTAFLSPTLPDSDVWAVSGGLGFEIVKGFEINASYFHAFYDQTQTTSTEAFPAIYNTRANIYALSVVWKP
jgi:long-chain fatty acid transport protein